MNLSDLLKQGTVKSIEPDKKQAAECLDSTKRDLNAAKITADKEPDWAFAIAYNAMLQATRALMFFDGFVPTGGEHHLAAVQYAEAKFGAKFPKLTQTFDTMRKKRHRTVYGKAGLVSSHEAWQAIATAEEFIKLVREKTKL